MSEELEKDSVAKKSANKSKNYSCPDCSKSITEDYLEQNLFDKIPCPYCSSIIEVSSLKKTEKQLNDGRAHKRCNLSLKVTYQSFDRFISEYTKNVSNGGMFIKTKTHHEPGSKINLFLHVPGLREPMKILVEVVHSNFSDDNDETKGIGIKFIEIDDTSRKILINYINLQKDCY